MTSFQTVVSNEIDEVHMIAGDDKQFYYWIYDENGELVNLESATCTVYIFRYGDPTKIFCTIEGEVTGTTQKGEFTARVYSEDTKNLSGVYQQQVKIVDYMGITHIPAQGKIVIFPSPSS